MPEPRQVGALVRWIIHHLGGPDQELSDFLLASRDRNTASLAGQKLGDILVASEHISQATLDRALELQKETGKKLGTLLVEMGVISTEEIIEAHALQQGMLKPAADADER